MDMNASRVDELESQYLHRTLEGVQTSKSGRCVLYPCGVNVYSDLIIRL
jgi:hypothetical protein